LTSNELALAAHVGADIGCSRGLYKQIVVVIEVMALNAATSHKDMKV